MNYDKLKDISYVPISGAIGYKKEWEYFSGEYYLGRTYLEACETMNEIIKMSFAKVRIV
jgi:hypothetical protein